MRIWIAQAKLAASGDKAGLEAFEFAPGDSRSENPPWNPGLGDAIGKVFKEVDTPSFAVLGHAGSHLMRFKSADAR